MVRCVAVVHLCSVGASNRSLIGGSRNMRCRELVGLNAVEALYKLLHHSMKIEIVTAKENLAKHRANVFAVPMIGRRGLPPMPGGPFPPTHCMPQAPPLDWPVSNWRQQLFGPSHPIRIPKKI